ncbi:MAG: xylulokinase [Pacificimonas sp.]
MSALGIDIGTSSVKALILSADGGVQSAAAPLSVSRPKPLWSEQDPADWLRAVDKAVLSLPETARRGVEVIGLTGQMHGAVLLGADGHVLRPAILWNDGRSADDCRAIEAAVPAARNITLNKMMPGFTAPKLHWVRAHESDAFAATAHVLLPKDYVRFSLTGELFSDMSDAAGTGWLNIGARTWSAEMLAACGLSESHMPVLVEGPDMTGTLSADIAKIWGVAECPVVAGGGDNAASAVGLGAVEDRNAFLSLGTSGVYFIADDAPRGDPALGVHCFAHAVPERWHRMGVILSAASAFDTAARLTGFGGPDEALAAAAEAQADGPYFLPYLSGERTPHDDPMATGAWSGLTMSTDRGALVRAALEGVAFALRDCQDALGVAPDDEGQPLPIVGGGARSSLWLQIIADALRRPLATVAGGEEGAALGAAKLAGLALGWPLTKPNHTAVVRPDADLSARHEAWRNLYPALKEARP